jgi:UDP-2,3-diacylglucosamine hydrolase
MRLWIFSDLHLTDSASPLYLSFLRILHEPTTLNDCVVFSGDIFDLLVGDSPYFHDKFQGFFMAIERLASLGVKLHYIEGNHDFHLRKHFPPAVHFHEESVVIKDLTHEPAKRIYIAHGDLVDQADTSYLKLRKILRAKPVEVLSGLIPGRLIDKIGNVFSRPLSRKSGDLPEYWPSERREKLRAVFHQFAKQKRDEGYDYIVLGHCHDLDQVAPYYFNMGYPLVHGQYLFYHDGLKRMTFP